MKFKRRWAPCVQVNFNLSLRRWRNDWAAPAGDEKVGGDDDDNDNVVPVEARRERQESWAKGVELLKGATLQGRLDLG